MAENNTNPAAGGSSGHHSHTHKKHGFTSQIGFVIALGKETEPLALFKSALNISLGQILCFAMIVAGIVLMIYSRKAEPVTYQKKKGKKNADKRKS